MGGYPAFKKYGLETKTGPYALQKAGYRTGQFGK